jgi:hypothetical protein
MRRDGGLEERVHDWTVRLLAEREHELLKSVDVGTRYDVVAEWARRPGQMILTGGQLATSATRAAGGRTVTPPR